MPPTEIPCTACGAPVSGRFCGECGAAQTVRACASCAAPLTPGARFCHKCGAEHRPGVAPHLERRAWTIAAVLSVVTVASVAYAMVGDLGASAPGPQMGNVGSANGSVPIRAPDISQMSPRERFDRLYQRVMAAAEQQKADSLAFFAPMALNAYQDLTSPDADARFHAAMIHYVVGELSQAKAEAGAILEQNPDHLLGLMVEAEAARLESDRATLQRAQRAFLAAYERELAATRQEYVDHRAELESFRSQARTETASAP